METPVIQSSFEKVLKLYSLQAEFKDDSLVITRSKRSSSQIKNKLAAGIILFLVSILKVVFSGGLSSGGGGVFVNAMTFRQREKDNLKKSLIIDSKEIRMKEGYKSQRVPILDVQELSTHLYETKEIITGKIVLINNAGRQYEFLEIFGKDKAQMKEDCLAISNYIIDNWLSEPQTSSALA